MSYYFEACRSVNIHAPIQMTKYESSHSREGIRASPSLSPPNYNWPRPPSSFLAAFGTKGLARSGVLGAVLSPLRRSFLTSMHDWSKGFGRGCVNTIRVLRSHFTFALGFPRWQMLRRDYAHARHGTTYVGLVWHSSVVMVGVVFCCNCGFVDNLRF